MFETENSLVKLLNDTTLAINLQGGIATGFWVGQGLVITCAHVVEEAYKSNANVTVTWKGTAIAARVVDFLNDIDLALLEVIDKYAVESHPCVLLSDTFDVGDKLYGFGYTDAYVNGESFTPEIEGITRNPYLIKLKQAQVIPGFSGSPLLNLRTGGVCGVTRKTRDRSSDLGGRAIPASIVLSSFRDLPDIQRDLSQSETEWNETLTATQKAFLGISKHESNFKEHVAELYRLLHYSVATDKAFAGRTVDHFIERRVGDFPIQRAIATFSNEVAASDVDSFLATMRLVRQSFPAAQGTIVSSQQFIADVQLQANAEGIQLTSSRDLEAQLFDGHTYAKQIHDEIEHNARYNCSMYIEPEIGEELRGAGNPASEVLDKWLSDPLWNQLTILGDVGTGKTFLTRMLSYRLSEQFIADPLTARLPIRIDLRNADRQLTLQTLVLSHFAEVGMSDVTFDVFKHALSRGRIVLILDGFDEMAARVTPQVTERNFQELAHAATGHAKVLLTCRTHYFRSRSEEEEVILGDTGNYGSEFARDLYWDLISRKGFHIAYLRPFNLWQIESYVNRVKGRDAPQAIKKIREIYNLEELCQRPLLLEMIVKSIDKIDARNISAAALYQVFTDAWIHRDKWRDVLTPDDKLEFLTGLSRSLFAEERTAIHHSSLTDHLKRELASRVKDARQLVEMDNEIRTASFLTRDDEGNYGFAHKSYREFFFARYLHGQLSTRDSGCLRVARLSPEVCGFLVDMIASDEIDHLLEATLIGGYQPQVSENALVVLYAIRRGRVDAHVDPAALTVRLPQGMQLERAQLDQVNLEGVVAQSVMLGDASLKEAVLSRVDFSNGSIERASFDKADLRQMVLDGANCQSSCFRESNLEGASCGGTILVNADFTGACVVGVTVGGADLSGAIYLTVTLPENCIVPNIPVIFQEYIQKAIHGWDAANDVWSWYPELEGFLRIRCFRICKATRTDVDDVVQDAFVQLWKTLPSDRPSDRRGVLLWLVRVARNRAIDLYRRSSRMVSVNCDSSLMQQIEADDTDAAVADIDMSEIMDILQSELSGRMMEVVRARFVEDLSLMEIAKRLGMTQGTIHSILSRAMSYIRSSPRIRRLLGGD